MMTDEVDEMIATMERLYRRILGHSWALLVERTPPDDASAVEAAGDLQRQLIRTGAAWLALCEHVRMIERGGAVSGVPAVVHSGPARDDVERTPASSGPVTVAGDGTQAPNTVDTPAGSPAPADRSAEHRGLEPGADEPPKRRHRRQARRARARRQRQATPFRIASRPAVAPAAASGQTERDRTAVPVPEIVADDVVPAVERAEPADGAAAPAPPGAPLGSPAPPTEVIRETGQPVFPLMPGTPELRGQLVAMTFNGTSWEPIAAWRRVFQQVLRILQQSDPERFAQMASELTLHNGRLVFNRERAQNLGPVDAGGGWYTTGQLPTALILQRLRRVLAWWELPATALEVKLAPLPAADVPHVESSGAGGAPEAASDPAGNSQPIEAQAPMEPGAVAAAEASPAPRTTPAGDDPATTPDVSDQDAYEAHVVAPEGPELSAARGVPGPDQPPNPPAALPSGVRHPRRRSRVYRVDPLASAAETVATTALAAADMAATAGAVAPETAAEVALREAPTSVPVAGAEGADLPRPVPPAPNDLEQAPPRFMPGAVHVPPAQERANVRWVTTASGTSLPLRPATSDE